MVFQKELFNLKNPGTEPLRTTSSALPQNLNLPPHILIVSIIFILEFHHMFVVGLYRYCRLFVVANTRGGLINYLTKPSAHH